MAKTSAISPLLHCPLLKIQRELCDIPRGRDRFDVYLRTMIGPRRDLALPLSVFNPMAKDHVAARLDELLQLNAEQIVQAAIEEANRRLADVLHPRSVGLVMADDLGGGWTNRYQMEAGARFGKVTKNEADWCVVLCWSSEQLTAEALRRDVLEQIYRAQYRLVHRQPETLQQMLRQEGAAQSFAEGPRQEMSAEELQQVRDVVNPHRSSTDYPTAFACLYGDEAAESVGYSALGIPHRAGFALARAEAIVSGESPAELL